MSPFLSMFLIFYAAPMAISLSITLYTYFKGGYSIYNHDENGIYLDTHKRYFKDDLMFSFMPFANILNTGFNLERGDFRTNTVKRNLIEKETKAQNNRIELLKSRKKPNFLEDEINLFYCQIKNLVNTHYSFLEKQKLYFYLTLEERHYFFDKVLPDLFKICKIDDFTEEDKENSLKLIKDANKKITELRQNRPAQLKEEQANVERMIQEKKHPYLRIISQDEFNNINELKDKCNKLKNEYISSHETNYMYEKLIDELVLLEEKIILSKLDRNEFLNQLDSISNNISAFEKELKKIKKIQDRLALKKVFVKY